MHVVECEILRRTISMASVFSACIPHCLACNFHLKKCDPGQCEAGFGLGAVHGKCLGKYHMICLATM